MRLHFSGKELAAIYHISDRKAGRKADDAFRAVAGRLVAAPAETLQALVSGRAAITHGLIPTRPGTMQPDHPLANVLQVMQADTGRAWTWLSELAVTVSRAADHVARR